MPPTGIRIVTPRLSLRELMRSDGRAIADGLNNLAVASCFMNIPHPYTIQMANAFVTRSLTEIGTGARKNFHLAITLNGTDKFLGMASLKGLNRAENICELAYWIGERYWRKGLATEAAFTLLNFGFNDLGITKVWAVAFSENGRSNTVLAKLGFVSFGTGDKATSKASGREHNLRFYVYFPRVSFVRLR